VYADELLVDIGMEMMVLDSNVLGSWLMLDQSYPQIHNSEHWEYS